MRRACVLAVVAAVTLVALGGDRAAASNARSGNARCASGDCAPAAPQMVERTIMVPQMSLETRTVMVPEYRYEQRQKTISVPQFIPKQVTVTRAYTVMIPREVTRTVTYYVRKPVFKDVEVAYTVCVPHVETQTVTRRVCMSIPTPKTHTVIVDEGHWEYAPPTACEPAADCCSPVDYCRPRCHFFRRCSTSCGVDCCGSRVWVSNPVERVIPYTSYEHVWEDVPYTCSVTVWKRERHVRTVRQCDFETEPHTKQVTQTVCVPETRTKTCTVTQYDCVLKKQTICYTACVPHYVARQVQVQVCKMVPKKIQVPVEPCAADVGCETSACENGCCTGSASRGRRCRGC